MSRIMKPAKRFRGAIHDRVECPDMGSMFDIVVIGPDAPDDGVSIQAHGQGVNLSLRLDRDRARRLGELLIQAADDMRLAVSK